MRRMLLLGTVALLMAAMGVVLAGPALAGYSCNDTPHGERCSGGKSFVEAEGPGSGGAGGTRIDGVSTTGGGKESDGDGYGRHCLHSEYDLDECHGKSYSGKSG